MPDHRSFFARVEVPFGHERVAGRQVLIGAKAAMQQVPSVESVLSGGIREVAVILVLGKDPIVPEFELSPVHHHAKGMRRSPGASRNQCSLGVGGLLGDDVDDAVHCVGAPRWPRPANYFDAIDRLQRHIQCVPEDACVNQGVDRTTVNQYQQFV